MIGRRSLGLACKATLALAAAFFVSCRWAAVVREQTLDEGIEAGDFRTVRAMLDAGEPVNGHPDEFEYLSPLEQAASGGKDEIVRLLLDRGADMHGGSGWGDALMAAIRYNHTSTVRLLISKGAWVNDGGKRENGSSYLLQAVSSGNAAMVKLLLDAGANPKTVDGSE
jgi:ankyrin repeat protein